MGHKRVRLQDLETVCGIDLGEHFGAISTEARRIMDSNAPEDLLVSPVPLQQAAFVPPDSVEALPKYYRWAMPPERDKLFAIFAQVQLDDAWFRAGHKHMLPLDSSVRSSHAAICLAANHVLQREHSIEVY